MLYLSLRLNRSSGFLRFNQMERTSPRRRVAKSHVCMRGSRSGAFKELIRQNGE